MTSLAKVPAEVLNADGNGALERCNAMGVNEMAKTNSRRGGRNNNPEGRNQSSGMIGTARANPLSAAVAVGGAVAAGVLLWSRRNQISDHIANLADQVSEWRELMQAGDTRSGSTAPKTSFVAAATDSTASGEGRTQAEIAQEALTLKEISRTE